jgi:hypothetical protein
MTETGGQASKAEREMLTYGDEFLVKQHVERLADQIGPQRTVAILEELRDNIASRIPFWRANEF